MQQYRFDGAIFFLLDESGVRREFGLSRVEVELASGAVYEHVRAIA